MAATRDDNARDERSVLRSNPATFSEDFARYKTTNCAFLWKRCLNYKKNLNNYGLNKKWKFSWGLVAPSFRARRSVMVILNLSESFAKPLVMAKLNMAYLSSLKTQQNCCRPTCWCLHLGYSVPRALHRTIWCRSTFGPRGPGLSNPTSFLRPALPMAPTRDDNARDKRSVLRSNPATFSEDFARYKTTNCAFLWKRCLNYKKNLNNYGLNKKWKFSWGPVAPSFRARRSVMVILSFSESLAKPLVLAKLNVAYLSSLKTQQNCCRPTCRYHHLGYSVPRHSTVPFFAKHFRTTLFWLGQSHLFLEAGSPNGTDKRRQRQRQTERPPPKPSDILRKFRAL